MVKASRWGQVGLGLALLLAACSGAAVELPRSSGEVRSAAVNETVQAEPTVVQTTAVVVAAATPRAMVQPVAPDKTGAEELAATQPEPEQVEVEKIEDNPEEVAAAAPAANEAEATEVAPEQPGATEAQRQLLANLTSKGVPPELHNEIWLNSTPLKLADLQGKVVIVEFWTFG